MKKILPLLILFCFTARPSAFPQGSLTPPGAPAPTMKTLDQIEPRTLISSAPFAINASGSYVLTQNLNVSSGNAITISASGVNLDLNGFTVSSTAASANGTAIFFNSGLQTATISNGHVRGNFSNGVSFTGTGPSNVRVSDLSVDGAGSVGIDLGVSYPNLIDRCTVGSVGGRGLHSGTVNSSVANNCGGAGIAANIVQGSWGISTGSFNGIDASSVSNCVGQSLSGTGINAQNVSNSTGSSTSGKGIASATVSGSSGTSDSNYGIYALEVDNSDGSAGSGTLDGINAVTVSNSRGSSNGGGSGISCNHAQNSYGMSTNFVGLAAGDTAANCSGHSTSGVGLSAAMAENCYGASTSGIGLQAYRGAFGCFGSTTSGTVGMSVAGIASYCSGLNSNSGNPAITCAIAIGCSTFGGPIIAPQGKFLGTP